jgi:glycosyltransferase involved in cell wall biosynthesis
MLSGGLRTKNITKQSQENMPLITVVTVVRNGEKTLEETILSVINQTYKNVEYIIVDGASTDGTLEVIKKYEDRIDYWVSEPDKGIYDAMNKGIDLATGEWINFMNSGDEFYQVTTLHDVFLDFLNHNVDIIYGDTLLIFDFGSVIEKVKPFNNIINKMIFNHQSSFVKTILLKKLKFDETLKICGDYNFFYKCYLNQKYFKYIPMLIAIYNAEYGVSHNYKIYLLELARIHGIEYKLSWKIKYYANIFFYLIKYILKNILSNYLVIKIKKLKYIF